MQLHSNPQENQTPISLNNTLLENIDIISDVLGEHKHLMKQYTTALCEASTEEYRQYLQQNLLQVSQDQFDSFSFMEEGGMYPLKECNEQELESSCQDWCNKKEDCGMCN